MTLQELHRWIVENPLPDGSMPPVETVENLRAALRAYAEAGIRSGIKKNYWKVWRAISQVIGMTLNEAVESLPSRGYRWFALWSRNQGNVPEFIDVYTKFLHLNHPDKIGPIAHENSAFFSDLFQLRRFDEIVEVATEYFRNCNPVMGQPGYLYENVWLTLALSARGSDRGAIEECEKLMLQFPNEGGALLAKAVAYRNSDAAVSEAFLEHMKKAKYIEPAALTAAMTLLIK